MEKTLVPLTIILNAIFLHFYQHCTIPSGPSNEAANIAYHA